MNLIQMPHGGITRLAKTFNVSIETVKRALRGRTKSALALQIRQAALKNGGKEYKTIN